MVIFLLYFMCIYIKLQSYYFWGFDWILSQSWRSYGSLKKAILNQCVHLLTRSEFQLSLISLLFSKQFDSTKDCPISQISDCFPFLCQSQYCSCTAHFCLHTHNTLRPCTDEKWIARHKSTAIFFFFFPYEAILFLTPIFLSKLVPAGKKNIL